MYLIFSVQTLETSKVANMEQPISEIENYFVEINSGQAYSSKVGEINMKYRVYLSMPR